MHPHNIKSNGHLEACSIYAMVLRRMALGRFPMRKHDVEELRTALVHLRDEDEKDIEPLEMVWLCATIAMTDCWLEGMEATE